MKQFAALLGVVMIAGAWAHPGHGLETVSHWHASDAFGPLAAVVVVAAVWWLGRRK